MIEQTNIFYSKILEALEVGASRLVLSDSFVQWTGADLTQKIIKLEALIRDHTNSGECVAICLPHGAAQGLAILSTLFSGRVPVILNHNDTTANPSSWIDSTKYPVVISSFSQIKALSVQENLQLLLVSKQGEPVDMYTTTSAQERRSHAPPDGTALVLYTSGSSGQPKPICVPQLGLIKTIEYLTELFSLGTKTVALIALPISHSMALNTQFLPTFFAAGHSHFLDCSFSIHRIFRSVHERKITFIALIGEILRTCWEEMQRRRLEPAKHVEHIQLAGGKITTRHLEMARDLFPNALIHKGYGLTEAIRVAMINSQDKNFLTSSVGKPFPFVDVEIRNAAGSPLSSHQLGEIHVRGPNVFMGFSTSQDIFDERKFYATGDLGEWNSSGELCIFGRKDSLVKINGRRVSCEEIETAALAACDLFKKAKCVLIEDQRRSNSKLYLFLEAETIKITSHHLQTLSQRLQALKYFPRRIILTYQFPQTGSGKVSVPNLIKTLESCQQRHLPNNFGLAGMQFFEVSDPIDLQELA